MRIIRSAAASVHVNLAWEEWLLDRFDQDGPALFFCVNDPAVVLGKNQNPWRETDPLALGQEDVALARRVSGGGTVYHDQGNLNYSLIMSRHDYRQEGVFRQVISTLLGLGIPAELMAGNGLSAHGRKFSGSAFCYRGSGVLHHGTLLVQADLPRLRRCMNAALPDIETRAIASKPASVVNLAEVKPGLTVDILQRALALELGGTEFGEPSQPPTSDFAWQALLQRNQSWDWNLGYTPGFTWTETAPGSTLRLHVEHGLVQRAELTRDSSTENLAGLIGCRFTTRELVEALIEDVPGERSLIGCLKAREF